MVTVLPLKSHMPNARFLFGGARCHATRLVAECQLHATLLTVHVQRGLQNLCVSTQLLESQIEASFWKEDA